MPMETYVTLFNYTEEGLTNMTDSPARLERAKEVTQSFGGEFKSFYLTDGQYDGVYIAEYPDAKAATQALITIAQTGTVETETLRAFPEDEYREIVEGIEQ